MGNNGAGQVPFMPLTQNQRPGLLLNNGIVLCDLRLVQR